MSGDPLSAAIAVAIEAPSKSTPFISTSESKTFTPAFAAGESTCTLETSKTPDLFFRSQIPIPL